jgi:hypothetical protein
VDATKVDPQPARWSRRLLLGTAVTALLLIGLVVVLVQGRDDAPATDRTPAAAEARAITLNPRAEEVATDFLEAFGAFDVEQMGTYLADDATITSLGSEDDPRLLISWLEATGYEQTLGPCEQTGSSAIVSVRCGFDFHALGSGEIGRGPFGGGSFDLVVQDARIVHVSQGWETEKFSPQVWEPFAEWVSREHPKDAAVMYLDETHSRVRVSEESIRLWKRNTQMYVDEVERNRRSVSRASSVRSG